MPARPAAAVTAPLFYAPGRELTAGSLRLGGPEGRHAAVVRRLRPGERVDVGDGAGAVAACVVTAADRSGLDLEVLHRRLEPAPVPRLVVVQALAKGERGEASVAAMTEVGVDEIVPWAAARSVAVWRDERADRARERWQTSAREAAKQARRARIPQVGRLASTPEVTVALAAAAAAVVLHESAGRALAAVDPPPSGTVVLVVGPEGGLTEQELAGFTAAGAAAVRLGPTVLRTSTAGVAALAVLLSRTSRWR